MKEIYIYLFMCYLGSPLDPDVLSPHAVSLGDDDTVTEVLDHNLRNLFTLSAAQGSQVILL